MTKPGAYLSAALVARVVARDGFACVYCGTAAGLTIDHVTPRAWGGSNAPRNLVAACGRCNSAVKGDHDLVTFAHKLRVKGVPGAWVRAMLRRVRNTLRRRLPPG